MKNVYGLFSKWERLFSEFALFLDQIISERENHLQSVTDIFYIALFMPLHMGHNISRT